jgi:hypothetical protein
MRRARRTIAVALLCWSLSANLAGAKEIKTVWSIWWHSDELDCDQWSAPMIATYAPCKVNDVAVSICPDLHHPTSPFDQGQPITIIGWELVQRLSDPAASGVLIIGSSHAGADGADVFGITGGTGTSRNGGSFQPGAGIPQGEVPLLHPHYAHLDLYGQCDKGTQQAFVVIYYTTP